MGLEQELEARRRHEEAEEDRLNALELAKQESRAERLHSHGPTADVSAIQIALAQLDAIANGSWVPESIAGWNEKADELQRLAENAARDAVYWALRPVGERLDEQLRQALADQPDAAQSLPESGFMQRLLRGKS
jgi:hypothetical protein